MTIINLLALGIKLNNRSIIFMLPVVVAIASMGLLFAALLGNWFGPAGANSDVFCEAFSPGLIKQPANTWSNLSFILVGLLIGWQQSKGRYGTNSNPFSRTLFYPTFFACLVVLLGPGSMAMHASTAHIGGFFDVLSMYLIASFMLSYGLERLLGWQPRQFSICFAIALAVCIVVHFSPITHVFGIESILLIFATYIVLASAIELYFVLIKKTGASAFMAFAFIGAFLLAFIIWNLSLTGNVWCNPDTWVQGHGAWHILNAVSLYYIYRYYLSEHKPAH
jgi:hypothetical protein